jgi:ferredoxin
MTFVFIITNAPLKTDEVLAKSICDQCMECVSACPGHAITQDEKFITVGKNRYLVGNYDKWQCSVYYRGVHKSNPYITDEFLKDHSEREAILTGDKHFTQSEAEKIYSEISFLPNTQYGYVPCLCKKACDIACYTHLENKGLLSKKYVMKFNKHVGGIS